jgi:hypothetical protein
MQDITLAARHLRRVQAPRQVRAESGALWITVDGEAEDIVLAAGESRRFDGRRGLVVYAIGGDARFQVECGPIDGGGWASRRARWGERLATWLRSGRPVLGAGS